MRRRDLGRFWPLIVAMVTVGGTALAQIPDADGVIHGCYAKNGALRVIDSPSQACKRGETAISWSQEGPPGEQGEPGEEGPPGADGEPAASIVERFRAAFDLALPQVRAQTFDWTQPPHVVQDVVVQLEASVAATEPSCNGASIQFTFSMDGTTLDMGVVSFSLAGPGDAETRAFALVDSGLPLTLFESATDQARSLAVRAASAGGNCPAGVRIAVDVGQRE